MMQPPSVMETCLYVDDLERAEEFYSRVLGLTVYAKVEGRHSFFRSGGGVFLLFNPEQTRKESPLGVPTHGATGEGHVAFRMAEDEIEAWRARLAQEKVEIELEYTWPNGGFSFYFRDSAGNSVELVTPRTWGLEK